ncbi:alpha/beta fold hydrolase [Paenibacillus sp. LMG 31456]|uniref:Alpha/beta fold hydrolase n=1 Tax=Paenibacillus foliorum TaxID=2654974 RepID=A0A972GZJ6_9BACL|nr:alpha/beta hydrolase [Paenibacillus foliorum]NOU96692.1 alpha/beta fold hydrolase [Paenibacillus foliorum]
MPTVELNGTQIYYQIEGNGAPVVCIHPPMLSSNCFTYLRQQLASSYQIITFDIRGHGASEPSERKVTYPLIVGDIRQLLDALHLPAAYLCGYSTGGSVALQAMLTYPDRFLGGILISSMPEMSDWYNRARIWAAIQVSRLKGKRLLAVAMSAGNADKMQTFKRLYSQAIQGNIRNSQEYFAYSLNFNCTKRLHEIGSPIQLIYGQKDKRFHRYAHILKRNMPQSTLQFIANAKHQLPVKKGLELSELIRSWIDLAEAERLREYEHGQALMRESVSGFKYESKYDLESQNGDHNEQIAYLTDEEFSKHALEALLAELSEQDSGHHGEHRDH